MKKYFSNSEFIEFGGKMKMEDNPTSNQVVNSKEEGKVAEEGFSESSKNEPNKIEETSDSKLVDLANEQNEENENMEENEEEEEEDEEMSNKPAHLVALSKILRNIEEHLGDFAGGGRIPDFLPWIEVKDVGTVPFPLTEEYAQKLIRCAVRSPFGRKDQTILDDRVRSRLKFSNLFCFCFDIFNLIFNLILIF